MRAAAVGRSAPAEAMVGMARTLFAQLESKFEPGDVQDKITPLLQAAIIAADEGSVFEVPEAAAPVTAAGDLMAALQASLEMKAAKKPTGTARRRKIAA